MNIETKKFLEFCKQFNLKPFSLKKFKLENVEVCIDKYYRFTWEKRNLNGWKVFYKEKPFFITLIDKEDWSFSVYEFIGSSLLKKTYFQCKAILFFNEETNRWEVS